MSIDVSLQQKEGMLFVPSSMLRARGTAPSLHGMCRYIFDGMAERVQEEHAPSFASRLLCLRPFPLTSHDVFPFPGETLYADPEHLLRMADEGAVPQPPFDHLGVFDYVCGLAPLHRCNHLPEALTLIRHLLTPETGRALIAFPGERTLTELRRALYKAEARVVSGVAARVAPFVDVKTAGQLMRSAGYVDVVSDVETITALYPHIFALIHDIRAAGESGILTKGAPALSKAMVMALQEEYAGEFGDERGVHARFDAVTLFGTAPPATD